MNRNFFGFKSGLFLGVFLLGLAFLIQSCGQTNSPTNPNPSPQPASTNTPVGTPAATLTPTSTPTPKSTSTTTSTATASATKTNSATATPTFTSTATYSPTVNITATVTPTSNATPGVDLTFSVFPFNLPSSTNPLVCYVANSLNNPTYTAVQTNTSGFFQTFNFNVPTANSPVYVELIYGTQGQSYPSSGVIQPHVGDVYGYYQAVSAGSVSFMPVTTAASWGAPNVAVTTNTTNNLGTNLPFGAGNFGGGTVETGFAGTVTLSTGAAVNSSHQIYMAAYPDGSFNRGGGGAVNSGVPLIWSGSSINGAWQDLRDESLPFNTAYYIQAWYDSNGQGSTGCSSPGVPCPHEGDPIYQYAYYGNPEAWYAGNDSGTDPTVINGSSTYSCSPLGVETAGATANSNTGGLLFEDVQNNSAISVNQVQIDLPTGTGHYEIGLYSSGLNGPATLLAETGYQSANNAGWNTANLNTTVSLSARTYYYFGFYTDTEFLTGSTSVLPVVQYLGNPLITNQLTAFTPASTGSGAMNLPTYTGTSFPSGSSSPYSQAFASLAVPCN